MPNGLVENIMARSPNKVRLNLAMPPETKELLDTLQDRTGAASVTETIRRAIALLDAVSKEQKNGGEIYVHRADGAEVPIYIF